MRRFGAQKPVRLDEKELRTDLGEGRFIFYGSSCDMWAEGIPHEWIGKVLAHCRQHQENRYLFQSKNPQRFIYFIPEMPRKVVFGTTIETNRHYPEMGTVAPSTYDRAYQLGRLGEQGFETMVTVEPIMNFDIGIPNDLIGLIEAAQPSWVNIGANTAHWIDLPEPEPAKVQELIEALKEFTEVKTKDNLKRLLK